MHIWNCSYSLSLRNPALPTSFLFLQKLCRWNVPLHNAVQLYNHFLFYTMLYQGYLILSLLYNWVVGCVSPYTYININFILSCLISKCSSSNFTFVRTTLFLNTRALPCLFCLLVKQFLSQTLFCPCYYICHTSWMTYAEISLH